jgi:hypothetical protein
MIKFKGITYILYSQLFNIVYDDILLFVFMDK